MAQERQRLGEPPEAPLHAWSGPSWTALVGDNELRMDNEFLGKVTAFFASRITPISSSSK